LKEGAETAVVDDIEGQARALVEATKASAA